MSKNKMTSTHTLVESHCTYKYLRVLCYLIALDLWMYFSYNSQCLRGFPIQKVYSRLRICSIHMIIRALCQQT